MPDREPWALMSLGFPVAFTGNLYRKRSHHLRSLRLIIAAVVTILFTELFALNERVYAFIDGQYYKHGEIGSNKYNS